MNTADEREIKRKLKVLRHTEQSGNTAKTCRYFGVSRSTFYRWRNGQLTRRQLWDIKRHIQKVASDTIRYLVPDTVWMRGAINETVLSMLSYDQPHSSPMIGHVKRHTSDSPSPILNLPKRIGLQNHDQRLLDELAYIWRNLSTFAAILANIAAKPLKVRDQFITPELVVVQLRVSGSGRSLPITRLRP